MQATSSSAEPPLNVDTFEASIAQDTQLVSDVTTLLNTLLEVCNQQWISDFLFTKEPVHIPRLTSRSLLNSAFTCDLRITRASFSRLQPDPTAQYAESHRFHARDLFVLSFNVDHTTVGVGVVESMETLDNTQLPKSLTTLTLFRNLRFVQNAKERWLLALMDSPDDDRILMHNCDSRWGEATRPNTFTAVFTRSKLLASVQNGNGCVTVEKLVSSMLGFMYTSQLRSCPMCGARPGTDCKCYALSLPPPANTSFDSQIFKNSMTWKQAFIKASRIRYCSLKVAN